MNTKKVTIKAKLILLASTLVLLLFIVGAFSINIQHKIAHNENIKVRFKNLWIATLELRRAEKDFLLSEATDMEFFKTGKSKFVLQFDTLIESVAKNLNSLKEENLIASNNFNLDMLFVYYTRYQNKFHELVKLKHERGELDFGKIGDMRKAIHSVEKMEGYNGNTETQVLSLRRTEKDFLLRKDTAYSAKLNALITKMLNSDQVSAAIKGTLQNYRSAFNNIVEIDKQIGFSESEGIMGELKGTIHEVEPEVDAMLSQVEDVITVESSKATGLISALLFIGLAAAILISFFVIRSIIRSMRYAVAALEKIANGELNTEIEIRNEDEIGILLNNMKAMAARLKDIVTNIQVASHNITAASTEMNASAQQMSEGATEQASSVEEISASMEEMAANIQQSTDNSLQTEKIARSAAKEISEGNEAVLKTVSSMKTIEKKISIVGEIARQTNLLALNAAVEAARAGEHGRGFAVVAAEVRKLAERSHQAALEINDLAYSSVEVAQHSGHLLSHVVPNIQRTAELVQEIAAASVEQSSGSVQVNSAIQQLNQVVQSNAATAEELAATAEELNAQSEYLKDMIGFFKIGDTATPAPAPIVSKAASITSTLQKKVAIRQKKAAAPTETHLKQPVIDLNRKELIDLSDKDYERF